MKISSYALLIPLMFAATAFANPGVNSPVNGESVTSPFTVSASSATCSSQSVSAMAYSIDNGPDEVTVHDQSIDAQATAAAGAHTVHVKSWGNKGAGCDTDIAIKVTSSSGASLAVKSPTNGESVGSPFTVSATAATCSSQSVSAMAYSIDSGPDIVTVQDRSMNVQANAGAGAHTVHVKSWGSKGAGCAANIAIKVTSSGSASSGGPSVPSSAVKVSSLQTMKSWTLANDPGNGGSSSGKMSLVGSPSRSGATRQTVTSYKNAGGERYWVSFGDDTSSTNFVYDGWVYLPSSATNLANLEMDMNSVMPNGQTVIYGFECDGYNNKWDYTENKGTPAKPVDTWVQSKAACKMSSWSRNTWHHVQVEYSRNDSGAVTYQAVWLDGVKSTIGATVKSAFALGWQPTLLTNLQVDGKGSSGSITVYLDDLTISRW